MTVGELATEQPCGLNFELEGFMVGLVPEWREAVGRFLQTEKGIEVVNDQKFREYVSWNSEFLESEYEKIVSGAVALEDYSNDEIAHLYDSISSLITTERLFPLLDFAREGTEREIQELIITGEQDPEARVKELLRKRKLASITEELSRVYPDENEAKKFEEQARALNSEVAMSDLDLVTSPRRVHAIFSVNDIDFGRLWEAARQSPDMLMPFINQLKGMQALNYLEIRQVVSEALASDDIEKVAVSGVVGDNIVLGRLRERLVLDERFPSTESRQGSIRQDNTNIAIDGLSGEAIKMKWILSFDLLLRGDDAVREMPIEVKNLNHGSRLTAFPTSYAPLIEVISIKYGRSSRESLEMTEAYCLAREKFFAGEALNAGEKRIIKRIHKILDPRIDNVLERLESPLETSTNYEHGPGGHPIIREVGQAAVLGI